MKRDVSEKFKHDKINSSLSLGQIFRFLQVDAQIGYC